MKQLFLTFLFILSSMMIVYAQPTQKDNIRLIRNATLTLNYAGHKILVDPMFSAKHTAGSMAGKSKNPMVDLPIPILEIVKDIELILLTHTHFDHFDTEAVNHIDKSLKLIHQPVDNDKIQKMGFSNNEILERSAQWENIKITRTNAQHGTGRALERMGQVAGFILQAENHPTIYIVGDAVWTDEIYQNIKKYKPDYIVINTGGARFPGMEATPIIMDEIQAMSLIQESGSAKIIAIHMEVIDHCQTTRDVLKAEAERFNISKEKLIIPADGQIIEIN